MGQWPISSAHTAYPSASEGLRLQRAVGSSRPLRSSPGRPSKNNPLLLMRMPVDQSTLPTSPSPLACCRSVSMRVLCCVYVACASPPMCFGLTTAYQITSNVQCLHFASHAELCRTRALVGVCHGSYLKTFLPFPLPPSSIQSLTSFSYKVTRKKTQDGYECVTRKFENRCGIAVMSEARHEVVWNSRLPPSISSPGFRWQRCEGMLL